jgi:hypothetical protein
MIMLVIAVSVVFKIFILPSSLVFTSVIKPVRLIAVTTQIDQIDQATLVISAVSIAAWIDQTIFI